MSEDIVKIKRHEYMEYIKQHILNVQQSFIDLKSYKSNVIHKLFTGDELLVRNVLLRVIDHDRSKYSKEEFEPYRKNFYPVDEKEKENNKQDFDKAFKHHYEANDHHWQNRQNTNDLNKEACIEMIIDWMAMGKKFNNTAYDYYYNNKENIYLNDKERQYTEDILNAMKIEDSKNK